MKKTNLKHKQEIFVNLKPTESELENLEGYWNAVDSLIINDSFMDINPMRKEFGGSISWKWAIVSINGIDFPAPYHDINKNESNLYTAYGDEVFLSNTDCALTTAYLYLSHLREFAVNWDQIQSKLHPFIAFVIGGGVREIMKINDDDFFKLMFELKDILPGNGWRVLD